MLVTPLIDPHFTAILFKGLAHSQHVAVAKDSKDAFDELMLFAIDFQVLVIQELHQRLRHCQSQFAHVAPILIVQYLRVGSRFALPSDTSDESGKSLTSLEYFWIIGKHFFH
ncbi:Uncharacterised protein [Klebsiella michiganensis]|uniref:Uncharacterized protein n=1 Tax=Klebsiella michiganensis TaxID=1134687 RepID=A0A7H4PQI1_9ENTR|nr:Uncharacterised protein [Klebsiella michiganensis]